MTVELDTSGLLAGDNAGLALLSSPYAWIGVEKSGRGTKLQMVQGGGGGGRRGAATRPAIPPVIAATSPPDHLWLRVHCNFDTDQAVFSWSGDGKQFSPLGDPFRMTFQLQTFQGVRPALFNFNTSGQPGGFAEFGHFRIDEPRAAGIEREVPVGKTVVFTSNADKSLLSANQQTNTLETIASDNSPTSHFQVIDLGKGQVALKSSSGRFVSVDSNGVTLKDLAGAAPTVAETFQWVNLMRGDMMLMSLTNHRYLASKPNATDPVTASSTGPRPDRKDGACFKWKTVD